MKKFIIDNQSGLNMIDALEMVKSIVALGTISNKGSQYCYLTIIDIDEISYSVRAKKNLTSYKFTIYKTYGERFND